MRAVGLSLMVLGVFLLLMAVVEAGELLSGTMLLAKLIVLAFLVGIGLMLFNMGREMRRRPQRDQSKAYISDGRGNVTVTVGSFGSASG
jgi:uncharacterized membrane protein